MPDTTATPDTLAGIYARYREIAPGADPDSPVVAMQLAQKLVVDAIRQNARCSAAILAGERDPQGWATLCAGFAAAHLMISYHRLGITAQPAAAEIADTLRTGDSIGEWLHEHALTLAIDPEEVGRLAEAEAALSREKQKAETPDLAALTERAEKAEKALAAKTNTLAALAARWDASADRNHREGKQLLDRGDRVAGEGLMGFAEALSACSANLTALLAAEPRAGR